MSIYSLVILGGFSLEASDGHSLNLRSHRAKALLGYLAATGASPTREQLCNLLWEDRDDISARNSLRQVLFHLRTIGGCGAPAVIVTDGNRIGLDGRSVRVDTQDFLRLATTHQGEALKTAASLYRGPLLDGLEIANEVFSDWLRAERERFRTLAAETMLALLTLAKARRAWNECVYWASRCLAIDPLDECVHRSLMLALANCGRRTRALQQYVMCREVLSRELGVLPERETEQLFQRLRSGELWYGGTKRMEVRTSPAGGCHPQPKLNVGRPERAGTRCLDSSTSRRWRWF